MAQDCKSDLPRRARPRQGTRDNLLIQIHFIIMMIRWTGLTPWVVKFPFPISLTSNFLESSYVNIRVGPSGSKTLGTYRVEKMVRSALQYCVGGMLGR